MERLQKILSQAGIASRRASEQLMLDGRVTVNGATVRELGTKADAAHDDIRVDGRRVFDSEGLLILTNDGDLAAKLTHPRHGVPRVYEARVLGVPDAHDLERLARG